MAEVGRPRPGNGLVLASASPRRSRLLRELVDEFEIDPADIDERACGDESPSALAGRLARAKAAAVAERHPGRPVLGSDTVVAVDGEALGKPDDVDAARAMLARLSGRDHEVHSAVALIDAAGRWRDATVTTAVRFAELPPTWIARYVAAGEPMDKAGAYAIQGAAGAWIPAIRGSYTGVVGLPLYETACLLRQAGLLT